MKTAMPLCALCALSAPPQLASADTLEVPAECPSIGAAIAASADGDTVLVAPGVYLENIDFGGKNIVVTSHFALDGDPDHIRSTVIDGSAPSDPDVASCVLIVSGEDRSAVLEGFTLTGGRGTRWLDVHLNQYYREGGGILIELSSPTIRHNLIVNNVAVDTQNVVSAGGGGIRIGDGILVWATSIAGTNNILWGNVAFQDGDQLHVYPGASVSMTYCDVQDGWPGTGNLSVDPRFAGAAFVLSADSPCIDAGHPDPQYDDPEDPGLPGSAEFASMGLLRADVGAYGGPERAAWIPALIRP